MNCRSSLALTTIGFAEVGKIVEAGVTYKDIRDMMLSRYACYLIVMNGDPRKSIISIGQT